MNMSFSLGPAEHQHIPREPGESNLQQKKDPNFSGGDLNFSGGRGGLSATVGGAPPPAPSPAEDPQKDVFDFDICIVGTSYFF